MSTEDETIATRVSAGLSARYHDEELTWLSVGIIIGRLIGGFRPRGLWDTRDDGKRGVHHVMRDLTIVLGVDATQFIDACYSAFYDTSSRSRNVLSVGARLLHDAT